MLIQLDQPEIEEALIAYIAATTLGVDLTNRTVDIKLIAGRGDNGHKAEIAVLKLPATSENDSVSPDADTEEEQAIAAPIFP